MLAKSLDGEEANEDDAPSFSIPPSIEKED